MLIAGAPFWWTPFDGTRSLVLSFLSAVCINALQKPVLLLQILHHAIWSRWMLSSVRRGGGSIRKRSSPGTSSGCGNDGGEPRSFVISTPVENRGCPAGRWILNAARRVLTSHPNMLRRGCLLVVLGVNTLELLSAQSVSLLTAALAGCSSKLVFARALREVVQA